MVVVPPKTAPRLFLIDAYALIYRSFFAFIKRPLTNSRGENTSAPFGFVNFLLGIRDDYQPDYLAVVFDSGMSHREKEYPAYKATREKMPDELRASLPRVRELVNAFHDPIVEVEGYEADDVIGTLARKAREQGLEAVIVSGDKDFYQLVREGVHLLNPGRGGPNGVEAEWVDETNASEKFGIPPSQVIDYLALIGDASDNVPGAPGIGPKTAVKLLAEFGSLEEILKRAGEVNGKKARESLTDHAEQIRLSKRLVTIQQDVDSDLDLDALKVQEPDRERLLELLIDLEFRHLVKRFSTPSETEVESGDQEVPAPEVRASPPTTPAGVHLHVADTVEAVASLVERARAARRMALHVESAAPGATSLAGIGIAMSVEEGWYVPLGHHDPGPPSLLDPPEEGEALPGLSAPSMAPLMELLSDPAVPKVGHDLKAASLALSRAGVGLKGLQFDTMVASYLIDPARRERSLWSLVTELLKGSVLARKDLLGTGKKQISFSEAPLLQAGLFAAQRAAFALCLRDHFQPTLAEYRLEGLLCDLEMPLLEVLVRMEGHGIRIDGPFFEQMSERLDRELGFVREEIYKISGAEFNLNSTPQLREILFDKLGLPVLKRTKTGPSTDASVLEELAVDGHELPRLLLEYRQLEKLRSTYVHALPRLVNRRTGRIHTSFNQTVAATGRLSSSDPNLQNIPIRTDLGREIRKGFIPSDGHLFLAVDYSQIELRVLAHFSGDEAFVSAFRQHKDVHRQTAAVIFGVEVEEVSAQMRAQAKTINFATLYGQGDFALARQLGTTRAEARAFIDQYFERFAGVRRFLDEQVNLARTQGYVETLIGRRRYIPELNSSNWNVRQFGERVAQNTPIQGTAADLMKQAMIDVNQAIESESCGARLLLQVHDELLFEVPVDEIERVRDLVIEKMEAAVSLTVPLVVDAGVGASWYECKA